MPDPLGNFEGGLMANWKSTFGKNSEPKKMLLLHIIFQPLKGRIFVLSNLIEEVADNYYELLALDNQLDIIQQYIKLQTRALEISKIQKQAAATTELAVKKFEAELAKSKATEYTIRQEITEKKIRSMRFAVVIRNPL